MKQLISSEMVVINVSLSRWVCQLLYCVNIVLQTVDVPQYRLYYTPYLTVVRLSRTLSLLTRVRPDIDFPPTGHVTWSRATVLTGSDKCPTVSVSSDDLQWHSCHSASVILIITVTTCMVVFLSLSIPDLYNSLLLEPRINEWEKNK